MAKVSFTKLGLTKNQGIRIVDYNDQKIEVKQYLPVNEKLELITNVINNSSDENNFSNPVKEEIYTHLEIIKKYTNISFTEKQLEDPCKLYDLLVSNNIMELILAEIPSEEYDFILSGVETSVKAVYAYRSSILGILDIISQDYSDLDLKAEDIQKKYANSENLALVKDIINKLG